MLIQTLNARVVLIPCVVSRSRSCSRFRQPHDLILPLIRCPVGDWECMPQSQRHSHTTLVAARPIFRITVSLPNFCPTRFIALAMSPPHVCELARHATRHMRARYAHAGLGIARLHLCPLTALCGRERAKNAAMLEEVHMAPVALAIAALANSIAFELGVQS